MEKYDAIYGRQSVDREDSISIESQIEYCQCADDPKNKAQDKNGAIFHLQPKNADKQM